MTIRDKIAKIIYMHIPYEKTEDLSIDDCFEVADKILKVMEEE